MRASRWAGEVLQSTACLAAYAKVKERLPDFTLPVELVIYCILVLIINNLLGKILDFIVSCLSQCGQLLRLLKTTR